LLAVHVFRDDQVVPTQYKTLYGELSYLNQYSVIEKDVPYEAVQRVEPIPGLRLRDFQGVVFTYDFHPVRRPAACCASARSA
jgi:hypothetical protein